jgi:hypothetical protein
MEGDLRGPNGGSRIGGTRGEGWREAWRARREGVGLGGTRGEGWRETWGARRE